MDKSWKIKTILIAVTLMVTYNNNNAFGYRYEYYIEKQTIHIAGLFPISDRGGRSGLGSGILPAVKLALLHVNKDKRFLQNYHLNLTYNDTMCDMGMGIKMFFDMMHFLPQKVILFGDACSNVTAPIAESSSWWNIWQLSYADTNPELSDRTSYPNFFRTVPSDTDYNPARLALLRNFDWNITGTVFQDASKGSSRYAYSHGKLTTLLDEKGIRRETHSFSSDPKPALAKFKEKDIRIIIGNFDEHMARKVFCSAYEEGMYGSRYAWLILGDYSPYWWTREDHSISCTPRQLLQALEGYIATDVLVTSTKNKTTISNYTPQQYFAMYNESRNGEYSKFHGYAYDGIWAIAQALDKIITENEGTYFYDDFRSAKMEHALNETNFFGVTGRVVFSNGDRVGGIVYKQFNKGQLVDIGEYDSHKGEIKLYREFEWQGSGPPLAASESEVLKYKINLTIYVAMCTLAGMGVILALFFLIVNIIYRNHRYIKMSSPNMNNLIIIGCIMAYVSVFLLGTDGGYISSTTYSYLCYARTWTLCIAFTLAFGAMFSKTWRVHAIFTNIKMNRKVIKDYQLFIVVAVLLGIDFILLNAWIVLDPMRRGDERLEPEIDRGGSDKEIIFIIEYCISDRMSIWLGVLYAYKGLLLLVGCFLAWETRQVSIPALNDSKYIGMSVYNVVITCVAGVAISFVVKDKPDSGFLIIALFIVFCTTITLCLVFVPKVIELQIDPRGDERRIRATLRKSISIAAPHHHDHDDDLTQKIKQLAEENVKYREILEEKKHEIEELLMLLGEDPYGDDENNQMGNCVTTPLLYKDDIDKRKQDDQCSLISNSSGANIWSPEDNDHVTEKDSSHLRLNEQIELSEIKKLPSNECMKSYEGLKDLTANNFNDLKETDIISQCDTDMIQGQPIQIDDSSTSLSSLFRELTHNIDQMIHSGGSSSNHRATGSGKGTLHKKNNEQITCLNNTSEDPTVMFQNYIDALPPPSYSSVVENSDNSSSKRGRKSYLEDYGTEVGSVIVHDEEGGYIIDGSSDYCQDIDQTSQYQLSDDKMEMEKLLFSSNMKEKLL